jgi:hypothetical protein
MLAYELDGRPLSRPHGAPVRVVMPAMYGYKNVNGNNGGAAGPTAPRVAQG